MRTLAIGDIHGCFRALQKLDEFVSFAPDDLLITLGDYVDRGPNSRAVLDWLIDYRRRGRLVALGGNHEIMMSDARENRQMLDRFLYCGGDETLASYSPRNDEGALSDVPEEHWRFLDHDLQASFETPRHFFVHANAYPEIPLAEQPDFMLYWESFDDPPPHVSGKIMICGHTPQRSGRPRSIGHAVCIDTWVYGRGWLTCLDVDSGRYWQANQQGETRSSWLEEDA